MDEGGMFLARNIPPSSLLITHHLLLITDY
jgi:hypothetical protein